MYKQQVYVIPNTDFIPYSLYVGVDHTIELC